MNLKITLKIRENSDVGTKECENIFFQGCKSRIDLFTVSDLLGVNAVES